MIGAEERALATEAKALAELNRSGVNFVLMLRKENRRARGRLNLDLNLDLDRIRDQNARLKQKVIGFVRRRLLGSTPETLERECERAVEELIEEIDQSLRAQSLEIVYSIEARLAELNETRARLERGLRRLETIRAERLERIDRTRRECIYGIGLSELLLDALDGGDQSWT